MKVEIQPAFWKRRDWTSKQTSNLMDSPPVDAGERRFIDSVGSCCLTNGVWFVAWLCSCTLHGSGGVCVCSPRPHGWMDGRMDRSPGVADGVVWVTALSSPLSSFLKGGDGKAEAQTQASLPALRGDRAWWIKGEMDRQRAQGDNLPFVKRTEQSHGMPVCHTEYSEPPLRISTRRGRQRALHFHTHLRRKTHPWAVDVTQ